MSKYLKKSVKKVVLKANRNQASTRIGKARKSKHLNVKYGGGPTIEGRMKANQKLRTEIVELGYKIKKIEAYIQSSEGAIIIAKKNKKPLVEEIEKITSVIKFVKSVIAQMEKYNKKLADNAKYKDFLNSKIAIGADSEPDLFVGAPTSYGEGQSKIVIQNNMTRTVLKEKLQQLSTILAGYETQVARYETTINNAPGNIAGLQSDIEIIKADIDKKSLEISANKATIAKLQAPSITERDFQLTGLAAALKNETLTSETKRKLVETQQKLQKEINDNKKSIQDEEDRLKKLEAEKLAQIERKRAEKAQHRRFALPSTKRRLATEREYLEFFETTKKEILATNTAFRTRLTDINYELNLFNQFANDAASMSAAASTSTTSVKEQNLETLESQFITLNKVYNGDTGIIKLQSKIQMSSVDQKRTIDSSDLADGDKAELKALVSTQLDKLTLEVTGEITKIKGYIAKFTDAMNVLLKSLHRNTVSEESLEKMIAATRAVEEVGTLNLDNPSDATTLATATQLFSQLSDFTYDKTLTGLPDYDTIITKVEQAIAKLEDYLKDARAAGLGPAPRSRTTAIRQSLGVLEPDTYSHLGNFRVPGGAHFNTSAVGRRSLSEGGVGRDPLPVRHNSGFSGAPGGSGGVGNRGYGMVDLTGMGGRGPLPRPPGEYENKFFLQPRAFQGNLYEGNSETLAPPTKPSPPQIEDETVKLHLTRMYRQTSSKALSSYYTTNNSFLNLNASTQKPILDKYYSDLFQYLDKKEQYQKTLDEEEERLGALMREKEAAEKRKSVRDAEIERIKTASAQAAITASELNNHIETINQMISDAPPNDNFNADYSHQGQKLSDLLASLKTKFSEKVQEEFRLKRMAVAAQEQQQKAFNSLNSAIKPIILEMNTITTITDLDDYFSNIDKTNFNTANQAKNMSAITQAYNARKTQLQAALSAQNNAKAATERAKEEAKEATRKKTVKSVLKAEIAKGEALLTSTNISSLAAKIVELLQIQKNPTYTLNPDMEITNMLESKIHILINDLKTRREQLQQEQNKRLATAPGEAQRAAALAKQAEAEQAARNAAAVEHAKQEANEKAVRNAASAKRAREDAQAEQIAINAETARKAERAARKVESNKRVATRAAKVIEIEKYIKAIGSDTDLTEEQEQKLTEYQKELDMFMTTFLNSDKDIIASLKIMIHNLLQPPLTVVNQSVYFNTISDVSVYKTALQQILDTHHFLNNIDSIENNQESLEMLRGAKLDLDTLKGRILDKFSNIENYDEKSEIYQIFKTIKDKIREIAEKIRNNENPGAPIDTGYVVPGVNASHPYEEIRNHPVSFQQLHDVYNNEEQLPPIPVHQTQVPTQGQQRPAQTQIPENEEFYPLSTALAAGAENPEGNSPPPPLPPNLAAIAASTINAGANQKLHGGGGKRAPHRKQKKKLTKKKLSRKNKSNKRKLTKRK